MVPVPATLAKNEGRKPRAGSHSCADPLLGCHGALRLKGVEKCSNLAGNLEERSADPRLPEKVCLQPSAAK